MVQNSGITKKTKVQFFNSYVLSQLANLYQYAKDAEEENDDKEHKSDKTVRHKVHELLLKICGSLKVGICFSNTAGAFATRYCHLYVVTSTSLIMTLSYLCWCMQKFTSLTLLEGTLQYGCNSLLTIRSQALDFSHMIDDKGTALKYYTNLEQIINCFY